MLDDFFQVGNEGLTLAGQLARGVSQRLGGKGAVEGDIDLLVGGDFAIVVMRWALLTFELAAGSAIQSHVLRLLKVYLDM